MPPPPHLHHPLGGGPPPRDRQWREVLLWRGPYQLKLAKAERTDKDALVHWANGGFLPPERPPSCWRLPNEAPPFRNARQAKKGGWSMCCPYEQVVWCVLHVHVREIRVIFVRLCHACALCIRSQLASRLLTLREKRAIFERVLPFHRSVCSFVIAICL